MTDEIYGAERHKCISTQQLKIHYIYEILIRHTKFVAAEQLISAQQARKDCQDSELARKQHGLVAVELQSSKAVKSGTFLYQ